jgi:hypothetical protein
MVGNVPVMLISAAFKMDFRTNLKIKFFSQGTVSRDF